jgi:hypothetical protein
MSNNPRGVFFFSQKNNQKALFRLSNLSASGATGSGAGPEVNRPNGILLFPEKEAKSVCSASQKFMGYPTSPRSGATGSGAGPRKPFRLMEFFFFQKKKQKA